MKLTKNQQKEQKLINLLVNKSWKDESFKKRLIASPIETIESIIGNPIALQEGVRLVIVDQTNPSYLYLNIPSKPDFTNMDLTDEQLEIVAGGEIGILLGIVIGGAILGAGILVGQAMK